MNNHAVTQRAINWVEQGLVPDLVIRKGIARLCRQRLAELQTADCEAVAERCSEFVALMDASKLAELTDKANEQHYEVPAAFYAEVLGRHRKYSSCYWGAGVSSLDGAEVAALKITCERAGLSDGMDVLELGCGWGSLTLWMAERYPRSRITAVSNSHSQRAHIEAEAARRGMRNVRIVTADMNVFDASRLPGMSAPMNGNEGAGHFDRIVSVEMFEHMRNWRQLFGRVASWLKPGGQFFMHVFCHRSTPYPFEDNGPDDWMGRHFFSGGMMPSDDLALHFQDNLSIVKRWRWDGTHYERTANAWLANMDSKRDAVWPVLEATYGAEHAAQWWMRWRIFFMSCAELFGLDKGQEWFVSHYLFERPSVERSSFERPGS